MKIHITLTARDIREDELEGKVAVVIDVLRATSVMVTALWNGAAWIRPVASVDEAFSLRQDGVLLGGERHALRIDGFDFSNSPLEYTPDRVKGKGIVLTTTNGTLALSKCGAAREVLIGAFLNQGALAAELLRLNHPVELVCAGTNGEFSLDDFLCAGLICETILASGQGEFDDLGRLAIETWKHASSGIHRTLSGSTHYNILKSKGYHDDLAICLEKDRMPLVVGTGPQGINGFVAWPVPGSENGHTAS